MRVGRCCKLLEVHKVIELQPIVEDGGFEAQAFLELRERWLRRQTEGAAADIEEAAVDGADQGRVERLKRADAHQRVDYVRADDGLLLAERALTSRHR